MRFVHTSLLSLVGAFAMACGVASEDSESGGSAQRVTPTHGPLTLLVTVPQGAAVTPKVRIWPKPAQAWDPRDEKDFPVGAATQLARGTYCISVTVPTDGGVTHTFEQICDIKIENSGGAVIALGGVEFKRQSTDVVLGIDMPFEIQPGMDGMQENLVAPLMRTAGIIPIPAGKQRIGPWFIENILEDKSTAKTVDAPDDRYSLRILPPDATARTLPDVPKEFGLRLGTYGYQYNSSTYPNTAYPVAITEGMTRIEKPLFYAVASGISSFNDLHSQRRKLAVFGTNVEPKGLTGILLDAGAQLGTPELHKFARLEVEHVDFTMSDGSKKTVQGKFSVKDPKSRTLLVNGAPTGAGIDVPAGKYVVSVAYKNPITNADSKFEQEVTLQ
jgi:hypothetical protein